jgi:hypothetical protein
MPDIRTILRSFAPAHALRNARHDVVEHARLVAEIDAIVQRLPDAEAVDIQPVEAHRGIDTDGAVGDNVRAS